jgi:hypothetical protein
MKDYSPTGRRNHGRPLKRLPDTWDRNGSTSGQLHDRYNDDEIRNVPTATRHAWQTLVSGRTCLLYGIYITSATRHMWKTLVSPKVKNRNIPRYHSGIARFKSSGMWSHAVGWACTDVSAIVMLSSSGSTDKNNLLFLKTYKPVTNIINICSRKSWR